MNTKYIDLIQQTFDFPQKEFQTQSNTLWFHDVDLMKLIYEYGSPLKFTYLPKISEHIGRAKEWFSSAFKKHNYEGTYFYSYCNYSTGTVHTYGIGTKDLEEKYCKLIVVDYSYRSIYYRS